MTAPGVMYFYPYFFFGNYNRYKNKICDKETCLKEVQEGLVDLTFINEKIDSDNLICEKIFDEKLYVCFSKEHFLANKEYVTYKELDGQSFLLGNDLGIWDEIVRRRLPSSWNKNFHNISLAILI